MVAVIEISAGDYGTEWINRMLSLTNTTPIDPISRTTKHEFEFSKEIPKLSWFDQFTILSKRMLLQLYRNRVRRKRRIVLRDTLTNTLYFTELCLSKNSTTHIPRLYHWWFVFKYRKRRIESPI